MTYKKPNILRLWKHIQIMSNEIWMIRIICILSAVTELFYTDTNPQKKKYKWKHTFIKQS